MLLPTASACVRGPGGGAVSARAHLVTGAQGCNVSRRLVQCLGLVLRPHPQDVVGAGMDSGTHWSASRVIGTSWKGLEVHRAPISVPDTAWFQRTSSSSLDIPIGVAALVKRACALVSVCRPKLLILNLLPILRRRLSSLRSIEFVSRRGIPSLIRSDCGTNSKGADRY